MALPCSSCPGRRPGGGGLGDGSSPAVGMGFSPAARRLRDRGLSGASPSTLTPTQAQHPPSTSAGGSWARGLTAWQLGGLHFQKGHPVEDGIPSALLHIAVVIDHVQDLAQPRRACSIGTELQGLASPPAPLHPSPGPLTRFGIGGDDQVIRPGLESLHLRPALHEALVEGDAVEAAQLLPDHVFPPHGRRRVPAALPLLSAGGRRDLGNGWILLAAPSPVTAAPVRRSPPPYRARRGCRRCRRGDAPFPGGTPLRNLRRRPCGAANGARHRLSSRPAALLPSCFSPAVNGRHGGSDLPPPIPAAGRTWRGSAGRRRCGRREPRASAPPPAPPRSVMVNERRLGQGARWTGGGFKGPTAKARGGSGWAFPGEVSGDPVGHHPPIPIARGQGTGRWSLYGRQALGQVARRGEQRWGGLSAGGM